MMNDYERRQAEERAAQRYPKDYEGYRLAYIKGYEDALDSVAGDFLEQVDAELAEDLSETPGIPYSTGGETAPEVYPNPHRREDGIGLNGGAPRW